MRFNPKARADSSQVRVRTGGSSSSGGLGGLSFPTGGGSGLKVGGGIGGVVILLLVLFISQCSGNSTGTGGFGIPLPSSPDQSSVDTTGIEGVENCETGDDANANRECAMVFSINSIQAFWTTYLPQASGVNYALAHTNFFTGSVNTACGGATSAVGPFYCPADRGVYLDTTFFADMLEGQLGASGGAFAEAYVLAHEYGHHVQNLLGTMGKVRTQQGAESDAVRLELQADCYAGMWAKFATQAEDANGEVYITELTNDDISRAINAAQAVGDDRIQQASSGRVNPDQWTHGSSASREWWFNNGLRYGDLDRCDTFSARDLHLNG